MSRLSIIFNNLISNAIRYADDTKKNSYIEVTILIENATTSIEIKDNGLGIEKEHLPHIFDRFYRVDSGRSRDQGGSGLGLNIVRWIAEAHGGSIAVQSVVGQGTTFFVRFPRRKENEKG